MLASFTCFSVTVETEVVKILVVDTFTLTNRTTKNRTSWRKGHKIR